MSTARARRTKQYTHALVRSLEASSIAFGALACSGQEDVFGGSTVADLCVPGQQVACPCPSGGSGVQTCLAHGSGFETCRCGEGGGGTGGTGGAAGAGGSGSAMACVPGTEQGCYAGPPSTQDVGECHGGTETCLPDGSGWTPCAGEVLPSFDNCATTADEDCDGSAVLCTGVHLWSKAVPSGVVVQGMDFDAGGNMVVAAYGQSGTADFGSGFVNGQSYDVAIAKLTPQGAPIFVHLYGDALAQEPAGVAVDPAGAIAVAGRHRGSFSFGGAPLTSPGGSDYNVFVAKLDGSGNHLWSKSFGGLDDQEGTGVASDSVGDIFVAGIAKGDIDLGGGVLFGATDYDAFVAKFDANGNHLWSKRLGDSANQWATGAAVTPSGEIVITGYFSGTLDLGGPPLTANGQFDPDTFVVKYDPAGNHLWSKRFGVSGATAAYAVANTPSGGAVIAGNFTGTVDFGGGPLTSIGLSDIFVAAFDASGSHLWSRRFGDAALQDGWRVAVDTNGNVLLGGQFFGSVSFGGATFTSAQGYDAYLVKLDGASGNHVWSRQAGGPGDQLGLGLAVDASGNVGFGGFFNGSIDLGAGPMMTNGGDGFLAKYAP
jgi:hypothetical protein